MEEVILEYIDEEDRDKVAVIPYDMDSRSIIGQAIEVTKRQIAERNYKVVGYIIDGDISIDDVDDDLDYYDMFGYEDDDD